MKRKRQYSVTCLRDLRSDESTTSENDWYSFQLEKVSQGSSQSNAAKRSATPDYKRRLAMESLRKNTSKQSHFSQLTSMARLDKEEQKAYIEIMDNWTHDMEDPVEMLPKDPQHGKVVWFNGEGGRIETVEPIMNMYEFCFRSRDCTLEDGEPVRLRVGDRVIFNLSILEQKLCATNVVRLAKRTISSPDLSRLILRQSELAVTEISPFEL